ncbi:MAG: endonuclease/exonuclease/phosphatase family protein [Bacteroidales bacterium]|nr:endonuclease/exonuclease/phosphatase family protein [Bacteroidales bacterium]
MAKIIRFSVLVAILIGLASATAYSKVTLPSVFSDNMVFQQNTQAAVWGWTDSGKKVTIRPSWTNRKTVATPDADGKWSARIQTPAAGGPYTVVISDGEKITLKNVLVGEVWFCSGQSNMQMPMRGFRGQPVEGAADAVISANPSRPIRMCTVKHTASLTPASDCKCTWKEHTPEAVASTSATAYWFALKMQEVLGVPIGILITEWGGSTIETWIDRETISSKFPGEFDLSFLDGTELPKKQHQTPCTLFNGQVNPLIPFTFKGMLWYQGEANRGRAEQYVRLQKEYVDMMRRLFDNPDAPFYYVQIAPYSYNDKDSYTSGYLCEAQEKALALIPHSGMATTLDGGEPGCIHPRKKKDVGDRLAYLALVNDYGFKGINPIAPTYESSKFEEGNAIVTMKINDSGISPVGQDITGFELAGSDMIFHPAVGRVKDARTVIVNSPDVPAPVAVRYCFRNWSEGNLCNNWGIPAGPFRSDDWENERFNGKSLRVMSYNIRNCKAKDEDNAWDIRRDATPAMILDIHPDIFGVQEAYQNQVDYILETCPDYKMVGVGRDDGVQKGEQMSVYYDTKRLDLVEWGTYWLSETPDEPSIGWDAAHKRTATWALMEQKASGRRFFFVNTHLDHKGKVARREGLAVIYNNIQKMNPDGLPMVLVGDFNVFPEDSCLKDINTLMKSARFNSADADPRGSFNGFGKYDMDHLGMIDYIYFSGFKSSRRFKVVTDSYASRPFISDHYPVYSDLLF